MTRLVLKLLLKASLPLALLVGTLSYGVYLRGGDPLALLRTVGSGIGTGMADRGRALAARAGDGARGAGAALSGAGDDAGGPTEVWTWRDAAGVTHFSSAAPTDATARTVTVDPRTNVLAPVPAAPRRADSPERQAAGPTPAAARPGDGSAGAEASREDAQPGVAGMLQGGTATVSPERAERMLRLLQGRSAD